MIDVLLVLLIIFMVIVPAVPRGEAAWLRRLHTDVRRGCSRPRSDQGAEHNRLRINQQPVAQGELQSRLAAIYANRAQRVCSSKATTG